MYFSFRLGIQTHIPDYDIQNQESIVSSATSKRKVSPLKSASLNFKFNVWKTKKINTFVLLNTDTDRKHMTTIQ